MSQLTEKIGAICSVRLVAGCLENDFASHRTVSPPLWAKGNRASFRRGAAGLQRTC